MNGTSLLTRWMAMAVLLTVAMMLALAPCAAQPTDAGAATGTAPTSMPTLQRMLLDRPPTPVLKPIDDKTTQPGKFKMVAGSLISRRARLTSDARSGWTRADIEASETEPAEVRWLLPSPLTERMEQTAAREQGAVFEVTGETFEYRKLKFLLPTDASEKSPLPTAAPIETAPAPAPAPASQPGPTSLDVPEELMQRLLQHKPGRPMLVAADQPMTPAGSVAPADRSATVPRPTLVADRRVRLVENEDGWQMARFESDNTLQSPPMRVLPCSQLDRAERLTDDPQSPRSVVLRVSGEVLPYKGRNYLLLRKVIRERELKKF